MMGRRNNSIPVLILWGALILFVFLYVSYPYLYYFTNDDFDHIPLSGKMIFGQSFLYRPLAEFTLFIDNRLWGQQASGYHFTNILIHLLNTGLVFQTTRLLLINFSAGNQEPVLLTAYLSALLFLIYPFHVESIFWILGRGAAIGCTCSLLSLIGFMNRGHGKLHVYVSIFFFAAGLFVYETVFVVPLMVTIIQYFEKRMPGSGTIDRRVPVLYWILFAAFLCCRYLLAEGAITEYEAKSFLHFSPSTLFYNLNTLVARSFLPPFTSGRWFLASYVVLLSLTMWALRSRFGRRIPPFIVLTALLYFVSLIPVLSLGIDTHDTEGDRFLYLPSVFFLAGCGYVITGALQGLRRYAVIASVSLYFTGFFVLFSRHYQYASIVSEQSLNRICEKGSYRNIYAVQLPTQYRGATIFRSGFEKALFWICPSLHFENVVILQPREIISGERKFITGLQEAAAGVASYPRLFSKKNDSCYLLKTGHSPELTFHPGKDMVLIWTDSSLVKIR